MARAETKAAAMLAAAHREDATAEVLASVSDWWAYRASRAGLTGSWLDPEYAVTGRPSRAVEARTSDLHNRSGHELGQAYVQTVAPDARARFGQHYTSADLADHLWLQTREALGWDRRDHRLPGLLRDPAAGAGALLLPPLREHLRAAESDDATLTLQSLPQLIEGIDQDRDATWLGNVILASEMLSTLVRIPKQHRRPLPCLIRQGDGLDPSLTPATIAIMNPPYGRIALDRERRQRFQHTVFGHANLYGLFVAEGARNLALDGILSALIPTSFAGGLFQSKLRGYLSEHAPLRSVAFVADRSGTFSGVLQETCLAVFARRSQPKVAVSRIGGMLERVADIDAPAGPGPWLIPREPADAAIATVAASMPLTLSDIGYRASTGPLVWNRRRDDIHSHPSQTRRTILWGADIAGGKIELDKTKDGQRYLSFRNEKDEALMSLTEPAVLVQRTTVPEQPRRLVPVELTSERLQELGGSVVVENHVNVLRPSVERPLLSRGAIARVLATSTLDRILRCLSGTVAVSSYELGALPMPSAPVLAEWEHLFGERLELAVAAAYRGALPVRQSADDSL